MIQAAALALLVTLAIPAKAAGERAVKARGAAVYPVTAMRLKIAGQVKLAVSVGAEGSAAAEDAVRKWKFEPGTGASTVEVSLNFTLSQEP